MLFHLRQVLFKFRVYLGALRTGIFGFALVCAAWVFAAPPSQSEIARLNLNAPDTAQHEGLRAHRIAKLLILVPSDRLYELAANRSGTGMSADDFRLGVILAAEGTPLRAAEAPTGEGSGAKFLPARTN